ncbi:MAG: RDD domain containing protein, partial [uncultured Nocardioides sp.]
YHGRGGAPARRQPHRDAARPGGDGVTADRHTHPHADPGARVPSGRPPRRAVGPTAGAVVDPASGGRPAGAGPRRRPDRRPWCPPPPARAGARTARRAGAAATVAGHLRRRRDVRRGGAGAGRSPPGAARRRARAPRRAPVVHRHVAVEDPRADRPSSRRRAGRDGPRLDQRIRAAAQGGGPRADRRQARHGPGRRHRAFRGPRDDGQSRGL